MALLSPSKSIPFSWEKILQIRNNLGHGGTDDQHHLKSSPKCTMCFISFLPLTCPLRATSCLTLLSAYTSSSFFSKCPSSPYFLEQLKPDFLHLAWFMLQNEAQTFHLGEKKKKSLPASCYPHQREIRGGCGPSRAERGKCCPVTDLETWWVGMNEQQETCLLPQGLGKNKGNCVIC